MGVTASSIDINPEELLDLQDATGFPLKDIRALYLRFKKLDRGGKGVITADDLMMIPELATNPLAARINELFDGQHEGQITFPYFLTVLSLFRTPEPTEEKLRFMFALYDVDGDGMITENDLDEIMVMLVGSKMEPEQRADVVNATMRSADIDLDGRISFDDFRASMGTEYGRLLHVPLDEDDQ